MKAINNVATHALSMGARGQFDINLRCRVVVGYDAPTSKEVGIGLLVDTAARAASDESCGFLHSGTPVMAVQTGSRKARQLLLRSVTGSPTCLDCRPDWTLFGSLLQTDTQEPNHG